jgi:uncharacterized protein YcfJ
MYTLAMELHFTNLDPNIMNRTVALFITAMLAAGISGCASSPPEPKLYPNAHLKQVGSRAAVRDIAECKQLARTSSVNEHKDGEVGRKATGGAAIGGATGGAYGLVRGDAVERGLAGAAAGAAAGTVHGTMQSSETSPVFKNFVNRCLRERGYEVIGWQ